MKNLNEVLKMTPDEISKLTHAELADLVFALITEIHFQNNAHTMEKKSIETQFQALINKISNQNVEMENIKKQLQINNKSTQQYIKKIYTKLTLKERLLGYINTDFTKLEEV